MTMKILLDPILTALNPAKCSTNVQFLTFVQRTLERRSDVFFYWLVPEFVEPEFFEACYPKHPNIRYIRIPQHKDRTKEYITLNKVLDQVLAFNGDFWDFDVLVTVRTGLAPLMKLVMTSPRHNNLHWLKELWLIEEMPLMDFKKTVACMNPDVQDQFTLTGYLAADRVYLLSYHEKPEIVRRARDFYTPSRVMEISAKIKEVCPVQFSEFRLKSPDEFPQPGRPFCVAHAGRMEMANQIDIVNDVMVKQFVLNGADVELLVCTQSPTVKAFDMSVVKVKHASRDEFWHLAKNNMHVLINMSVEGGFSLSLMEPMMLGTPAIVHPSPWALALLGKDYPFFANSETLTHGLVNAFHDDYPAMYERFAKWHAEKFVPLFTRRFKEDLLYDLLDKQVDRFQAEILPRFEKDYPGKAKNKITDALLKGAEGRDEIVIGDLIKELGEKGVFSMLAKKLDERDRDKRGLIWASPWNEFRCIMRGFWGWEDASTTVGHLRRVPA